MEGKDTLGPDAYTTPNKGDQLQIVVGEEVEDCEDDDDVCAVCLSPLSRRKIFEDDSQDPTLNVIVTRCRVSTDGIPYIL
jgi:hypothetical protein